MDTQKDKFKVAADLLLKGAKMLNIACPVCNDPIFKLLDGSMFCSNCDKKVVYEADETKMDMIIDQPEMNPIQRKIDKLAVELDNEKEPGKIIQLAELINQLQKLI